MMQPIPLFNIKLSVTLLASSLSIPAPSVRSWQYSCHVSLTEGSFERARAMYDLLRQSSRRPGLFMSENLSPPIQADN